MATDKLITMKQFNGTEYDTLYPKTKVEQVEGAYTQQQILSNATRAMFGLGDQMMRLHCLESTTYIGGEEERYRPCLEKPPL